VIHAVKPLHDSQLNGIVFLGPTISHPLTPEEANKERVAKARGRSIHRRQQTIAHAKDELRQWDIKWAERKHLLTGEERHAVYQERRTLSWERKILRREHTSY